MPSPFPGMDPYLERPTLWPNVHGQLILETCNELNARLPDRYVACFDLQVVASGLGEPDVLLGIPDVFVESRPAVAAGGVAVIDAPAVVTVPVPPAAPARRVTVRDAANNRVVAVVELLSHTNKRPGSKYDDYAEKREGYAEAGVALVEIDLLRAGRRHAFAPVPDRLDYYALVLRPGSGGRAGFWPLTVRDPLPDLPVPLAGTDPDAVLPLGELLARVYDRGRYRRRVRYDESPVPPLSEPDATWARDLLVANSSETTP